MTMPILIADKKFKSQQEAKKYFKDMLASYRNNIHRRR